MTTRRTLAATSGLSSGLLDSSGNPLPSPTEKIDLTTLPLIERHALPGLLFDMEGRLLEGDEPVIVLYHLRSELHIEVPLLDLANLPRYIEAVRAAVMKQGMGEAPEDGGYRVGLT